MDRKIRVTVWNEYRHERADEAVAAVYPEGIHGAIAGFLNGDGGFEARTATLDEPLCGLSQEVLDGTDVLVWWGHLAHEEVPDEVVDRVQQRVLDGMGLIVLHSGHASKIFRRMTGTRAHLRWREIGERERLWVVAPHHPIAAGLGDYIEIPHEEMYGEYFQVPAPDELIFISWFEGGEVCRSGCCYNRERGRIFYFRPGHELFPVYHMREVQRVLKNAVRWAAAPGGSRPDAGHKPEPLEPVGRRG